MKGRRGALSFGLQVMRYVVRGNVLWVGGFCPVDLLDVNDMDAQTESGSDHSVRHIGACGEGGSHHEPNAPIRAGMRARAVADSCELLGLPTIMVDATGGVLHVGPLAQPMLGREVTVVAGHLVGCNAALSRRIASAVSVAIGSRQLEDSAGVADDDAAAPSMLGLAIADPSPFQLMAGIVVIGVEVDRARASLDTLRAMIA